MAGAGRGSRCDCGLDESNTVLLTRLVARASLVFSPPLSTRGIPPSRDCLLFAESLFYQIANNKPCTFSPISVHWHWQHTRAFCRVPEQKPCTITVSITDHYYNCWELILCLSKVDFKDRKSQNRRTWRPGTYIIPKTICFDSLW